MMKQIFKLVFLSISFLFFGYIAKSQTNISGTVNDYAGVKNATGSIVTVNNAAEISNYSVGDKILLIQMKGAIISEANDATYGDILSFDGAGNYEFNEIASITGTKITVRFPLCKEYVTALHPVQVIRVPVYTDATVVGDITGQAWDGATGGVIAFEAIGTLTVNADINAESLGFRGGDVSTAASAADANLYVCDISTGEGGIKGEGIIAIPDAACRGKLANGGGGGNDHNSGGGGGGNFGAGGIGGNGWPTEIGQGGVGGLTLAKYYTVGLPKLFLGGGGGGGHQNNGASAPGSNGGGIIIIQADVLDGGASASKISAKALDAVDIVINDGAGGGGSGGSVLLEVNTYLNTNNLIIDASGGDGGSVTTANGHGPGGGGGGGFIHAKTAIAGTVTMDITGGDPGIFYSTGSASTSGTSRDATSGSIGAILEGSLSIQNCSNPPDLDLDDTNAGTGFSTIFNISQSGIPIGNPGQVNIIDIDNIQMELAEITLTNPLDGSDESLSVDDAAMILANYGITVTVSADDHSIYLNGNAPIADYETVLGLVNYSNLNAAPNVTLRLVEVFVNDGGASSANSVTTISFNYPPTVDIQGAPAIVNDNTAYTVTIEFSEDITGFDLSDITVANGVASNLQITDGNTYTADITPDGIGNITIDVAAGVAQDVAANGNTVASQAITLYDTSPTIAFNITSSNGDESVISANLAVDLSVGTGLDVTVDYVVTGTATGGTDYTLVDATLTIGAGDVDNSENITIAGIVEDLLDELNETVIVTLSNPTNASLGTNTIHIYTINDNDNSPILTATSEIIPEGIKIVETATSTDADTGDSETFSISGTDAILFDIDPSTGELTFKAAPDYENPLDNGGDNIYDLDITVTDGGSNTDTESIIVTITGINDNDPILSVNSSTSISEGTILVETATSTDADAGDSKIYFITGTDAALFDIDPITGELTFKAAPDYENPQDIGGDNIYNLDINVIDGGSNTDTEPITVTVIGTNDSDPILTINSSTSISEGTTIVETVTSTDADTGDSETYSITGTDAVLFDIDPSTGELTFKAAPDYENPQDNGGDNIYNLDITVTDGGGNTDTESIIVTITGINDNDPVLTVNSSTSISEGTRVVDTATSTDADTGDSETYSITGTDAALFDIDPTTGELTFKAAPDFDLPQDSGADNVYDLDITVSDGAGNTDTQSIEVTVLKAINKSPTAVQDEITIDEGEVASGLNLLANDSDPDGDDLIINTIPVVNTENGELVINTDGTFTYTPAVDFFGTDSFSYEVCDINGDCSIALVAITVNEINRDLDNDGIPNDEEGDGDSDGDGIPDKEDSDSDNDRIPDIVEGNIDTDGDGIPDYKDTDSDNDGIEDKTDGTNDTDGDGIPDNKDTDSDNDGIPDDDEGNIDTDGDGTPNYKDEDSDNDGFTDAEEIAREGINADCDEDGIPNYQDSDRCDVAVSKGFSPNGDGENDYWEIRGIEEYVDNNVKVYNRWGNLIFEVESYNNDQAAWIGQSEGALILGNSEVPDGTYFYMISLGDGNKPLSGYVIVKR